MRRFDPSGSGAFVVRAVVRLMGAGLLAGCLVGWLVVSGSAKEPTATAECESNRCEGGQKCVYHEADTWCDAIGKLACITLPCSPDATAILGWLKFEDTESSDGLVAMGPPAMSAVLGYAGLPEYRHRPTALNVLERMHRRWGSDAFMREEMRRMNALAALYLGPAPAYVARDQKVSVMIAAIDLALELGGRRLRSTVQELASNPDEVLLRLGEGLDHTRVVEHARARLTPP